MSRVLVEVEVISTKISLFMLLSCTETQLLFRFVVELCSVECTTVMLFMRIKRYEMWQKNVTCSILSSPLWFCLCVCVEDLMLHVFLWGRRHTGNNKLLEGGKETSNVKVWMWKVQLCFILTGIRRMWTGWRPISPSGLSCKTTSNSTTPLDWPGARVWVLRLLHLRT